MGDFDVMAGNILEMLQATSHHTPDPGVAQPSGVRRPVAALEFPLVSDWWGEHVYDATVGWGRLWQWLNGKREKVVGPQRVQEDLARALEKTKTLFRQNLAQLSDDVKKVVEHLGHPHSDIDAVEDAKSRICRWTLVLGHTLQDPGIVRTVNDLFEISLLDEEDRQAMSQASEVCCLLDLASSCGRETPMKSLKRLAMEKELTQQQEGELSRWLETIKPLKKAGGVANLHEAFCAAFRVGLLGEDEDAVAVLENALVKRGYTALLAPDGDYIQRRDGLKNGDAVVSGNVVYHLKEKVVEYPEEYAAFTVEEDPGSVIVIGTNAAVLGMEGAAAKGGGFGFPLPKILGKDTSSGVFLVERLARSLIRCPTATALEPFLVFLRQCLQENVAPVQLDVALLWLDQAGGIKTLKKMEKGSFDFNVLEEAVETLAAGQRSLYEEMMKASGLADHRIHAYYQSAIEAAVKDQAFDASIEAAVRKIGRGDVVRRAQTLANTARSVRKQAVETLKNSHAPFDDEELKRRVGEQIVVLAKGGVGNICQPCLADLVAEVVKNVLCEG